MKNHPLLVVYRSLRQLGGGAAHFSWKNVGQCITRPNGRTYKVFRQVVMKRSPVRPSQAGGVFCVWFHAKTGPAATIAMSWLTTLFFVGMEGFRSKTWLYDEESGEFGGIYEWDTLEQAQAYGVSFAMKLSALRAVPHLFSKEAYPMSDPRLRLHQAIRLEPDDEDGNGLLGAAGTGKIVS